MITVEKLKEIRLQGLSKVLEELEEVIISKNLSGITVITYNLTKQQGAMANAMIEELKKAGYRVKRSQGSDMRGESWDFLSIDWA